LTQLILHTDTNIHTCICTKKNECTQAGVLFVKALRPLLDCLKASSRPLRPDCLKEGGREYGREREGEGGR